MASFQELNSNPMLLKYLVMFVLFWFITIIPMIYSIYFLATKQEPVSKANKEYVISMPIKYGPSDNNSTLLNKAMNEINKLKEEYSKQYAETNKAFKDHFIDNKTVDDSLMARFTNLPYLDLNNMNNGSMMSLENDIFHKVVNLKELYLKYNRINFIRDTVFHSLKSLQILDLSFNELLELSSETFKYLDNLKSLFITNNKLKSLKRGMFEKNVNLEFLFLSRNFLQDIHSDQFTGLNNLLQLDLSGNNIKSIQRETFANLRGLIKLDISANNALTSVSSEMFKDCKMFDELTLDRSALNEVVTFGYGRSVNKINERSFFVFTN